MFAWLLALLFKPKRFKLFMLSVMIAVTLLVVLQHIMTIPVWGSMLILPGIGVIFPLIFTGVRFMKVLMGVSLTMVSTLLCEIITYIAVEQLIFDREIIVSSEIEQIIMRIIFIPLQLGVFYLLIVLWRLFVDRLPLKSIQLFILIPISQLFAIGVLLVYSFRDGHAGGLSLAFIVLAIFLAADIGMFYAMRRIRENDTLRQRNELVTAQLQLQFEHYDKLAENTNRIRNLRHDLANHIQTIQSFISNNETAAAKALLDQYSSELLAAKEYHYCTNRVIDALLLNKVEHAAKLDISLNVNVDIPDDTSFDDLDLCSVFANMLDNAIAASERISEGYITKKIQLDCYSKSGYLVIRCHNNKQHQIQLSAEGTIISSKQRSEDEQGVGLLILEDIATKYDGECSIEYGEHFFQVIVYLAMDTE